MSGEKKWYRNPIASFFLWLGWVLIALPIFGGLKPHVGYRRGEYLVRAIVWPIYALVIYWLIHLIPSVANADRLAESRKNLEQTAIVLKMYAADHNGYLPATLEQTSPGYAIGSALFLAKYRNRNEPWTYYSGHREGDEVISTGTPLAGPQEKIWLNSSGQQKAVVVRSPAPWKDVWLVVFSDFSVANMSDDDFKKLRMDDSNPPAVPARVQEQRR